MNTYRLLGGCACFGLAFFFLVYALLVGIPYTELVDGHWFREAYLPFAATILSIVLGIHDLAQLRNERA